MKKTNCIHAKTCSSNCGICNIYQSSAPKNRDDVIMYFVGEYFNPDNNDVHLREEIKNVVKGILTEKEYRVFEFEISDRQGV